MDPCWDGFTGKPKGHQPHEVVPLHLVAISLKCTSNAESNCPLYLTIVLCQPELKLALRQGRS